MRAATLALLMIWLPRRGRSRTVCQTVRFAPSVPTAGARGTASRRRTEQWCSPNNPSIFRARRSCRAVVSAQCGECAWDTEGREAVTLTTLGGRRATHSTCRSSAAAAPTTPSCSAARTPGATRSASTIDPATTASGLRRRRRRDRAARGHAGLSGRARASGPGARAVRLRAPEHGRALHRRAGVHVVRARADGARHALSAIR